jgi:hypothetical protein
MRRMVNAMEFLNVRRARAARAAAVRLVGYLSVVVVGSISCAQQGAGDRGALTAPSAVADSAQTQMKPGPSYDASGEWFMTVNFSTGFHGEGCLTLAQDSTGDITTDDGHRAYTFKLQGGGQKNVLGYKVTIVDYTGDACDARPEAGADLSGKADLDTTTNIIALPLSGAFTCQKNVTAPMSFSNGCV